MTEPTNTLRYVDLETARAARGVRLVVMSALPSAWSEAAKGIFHVKRLPALVARFRREHGALAAWTGSHNVPVVVNDDEPPRTGWAEILALAERLGGARPLVPADPEGRARLHGLAHELAGEGGLGWCSRLVMLHASFASDGARGFPIGIARFLAPRYGYEPAGVPAARARIVEVLALFERQLANGGPYLMGGELTALDLYLAAFLTPLVGVSDEDCPQMMPALRPAFAALHEELGAAVPPPLAAHRAEIYRRHLPWPISL